MLENKVSNLLAEVKKLKDDIGELNVVIEENKSEKELFNTTIDQLEEKIKKQRQDNVDLRNENSTLRSQGGE
jgi:chromosome segregation ATPase